MERREVSDSRAAQPATTIKGSSASLISRVGASASGLMHETVLRPSPRSMVNELASSTAGASKGSAPPGSSTTYTPPQLSGFAHSQSVGNGDVGAWRQGFRSYPSLQDRQATEDRFESFLSSQEQDPSGSDQLTCTVASKDTSLQYEGFDAPGLRKRPDTLSTLAPSSAEGTTEYVFSDDAADGAAVVALLSDPSFCVDNMPEFHSSRNKRKNGQYSEEYPRGLVTQTSSAPIDPLNPLDLIPDFTRGPMKSRINESGKIPVLRAELNDELRALRARSNSNVNFEVQPWIDMLTRYHDEVWGDMLPLVEAAREEAEAIQSGDPDRHQVCIAIRRLAMIVGHVSHGLNRKEADSTVLL
ncbi:MAG: hypothetical protein Q9225_000935 [Loekoesia sp. 1 TL-2023]